MAMGWADEPVAGEFAFILFVLIVVAAVGLPLNCLVAFHASSKLHRSAFNTICASRAACNILCLLRLFVVYIPSLAIAGNYLPIRLETFLIHIANNLYLTNIFTSGLLAINRFIAMTLSVEWYNVLCHIKATLFMLFLIIGYRIYAAIRDTLGPCDSKFFYKTISWEFVDPACRSSISSAPLTLLFLFIAVTGINLITFIVLVKYYTFVQDLVFVAGVLVSLCLGDRATRLIPYFFLNTFHQEFVPCLDGLVMTVFNKDVFQHVGCVCEKMAASVEQSTKPPSGTQNSANGVQLAPIN